MRIAGNTRFCDIFDLPEFQPMKGQFVSASDDWFSGGRNTQTVRELIQAQQRWNEQDTIAGLNRLRDVARNQEQYVLPLSAETSASLIWMPSSAQKHNSVCLILSGGAYSEVNSMFEAIPAGAVLNDMGYDCYVLNYRTIDSDALVHGLMPAPLEDLRDAICRIQEKEGDVSYYLIGFSTGGNACALWCTEKHGAGKYGIKEPSGMILAYPLISMLSLPYGPGRDYIMQGVFGTGYNRSLAQKYDPCSLIHSTFPPVYLIRASDDYTIAFKDAELFDIALQKKRIPRHFDIKQGCGHSFSIGTGTAAENWLEHAIRWVEAQNGRSPNKYDAALNTEGGIQEC